MRGKKIGIIIIIIFFVVAVLGGIFAYLFLATDIFKGNKTCKDLAPELMYKQKLEQDPLLKKYRSRYQSLHKSASLNPELNTQRYEDFKKIGAIKKNDYLNNNISAKEFEEWIESTKIKQTKK